MAAHAGHLHQHSRLPDLQDGSLLSHGRTHGLNPCRRRAEAMGGIQGVPVCLDSQLPSAAVPSWDHVGAVTGWALRWLPSAQHMAHAFGAGLQAPALLKQMHRT
jgi:hypothetical protein